VGATGGGGGDDQQNHDVFHGKISPWLLAAIGRRQRNERLQQKW
jgi:hypothetical protein